VHQIHNLFRPKERREPPADEQSDELAFSRLRLLTDDGKLGSETCELEGAFDTVVVRKRDAVEATFATARDQRIERGPAVV
jgi:hypothetical protein